MGLSLKEALGPPGATKAGDPALSGILIKLELAIGSTGLSRPIDFILALQEAGVSLGEAHSSLEQVASGALCEVDVKDSHVARLEARLGEMGILACRVPSAARSITTDAA